MFAYKPLHVSGDWPVASPSEAFMEPSVLLDLSRSIDQGDFPNIHAILIEHAGHLIYEAYFEGDDYPRDEALERVVFDADTLHDLRSVSKSVTALLLGIALGDEFDAAIARPIRDFFPDLDVEYGPGIEAVTLHHVLTMTAGLKWDQVTHPPGDPGNDEYLFSETERPIEFVLGRPIVNAPGTTWTYSSGLTEVVAAIIGRRTSKRLDKFAEEVLFEPLGIRNYEWFGSRSWLPVGMPSASFGLRLRARDLAKIGSLILHNGTWNGKQVVPAAWIEIATRAHVDRIGGFTAGIYGYGFQWYPGKSTSVPSYPIIAAVGNGGQRLLIFPEQHLVLTVLAGNYNGPYQDHAHRMQGRIVRAHRDHL